MNKLRTVVYVRVRVHEKCDIPEIGACNRNRELEQQTSCNHMRLRESEV